MLRAFLRLLALVAGQYARKSRSTGRGSIRMIVVAVFKDNILTPAISHHHPQPRFVPTTVTPTNFPSPAGGGGASTITFSVLELCIPTTIIPPSTKCWLPGQ